MTPEGKYPIMLSDRRCEDEEWEIVYALTGTIVPEEDKYLLKDVWWWTIGFHNLNCSVLKPPAGV